MMCYLMKTQRLRGGMTIAKWALGLMCQDNCSSGCCTGPAKGPCHRAVMPLCGVRLPCLVTAARTSAANKEC
jgi:hypothetical protein